MKPVTNSNNTVVYDSSCVYYYSNPAGGMDTVSCECCVLSHTGLCDGLILGPRRLLNYKKLLQLKFTELQNNSSNTQFRLTSYQIYIINNSYNRDILCYLANVKHCAKTDNCKVVNITSHHTPSSCNTVNKVDKCKQQMSSL